MSKVLKDALVTVFDVETTGLIPRNLPTDGSVTPIDVYPYILQLSFIVYDLNKREIVKKYNEYIRVADKVFISPKITEITRISRETCNEKGVDIVDALHEFHNAYVNSMYVVAHNLAFDQVLIEVETHRNIDRLRELQTNPLCLFNSLYNKINNIQLYCTMRYGKNICNILVERKPDAKVTNTVYKKFPKLSELHGKLFEYVPENLHDAYVDTYACLKCFLKMKYDIELQ